MKLKPTLLLLIVFIFLSIQNSYGQSYGLGFYSHAVVQDQRTGLDLSPNKNFCFTSNFELSFDFTFLPKHDDYFGYILRFVVSDQKNIDLIYDKDPKEKNHFKIIIGDKFSRIAFDVPSDQLFNNWNKIKIRFDLEKDILELTSGNYHAQVRTALRPNDCFKILFGANEYGEFKTADNPPMKIRNVNILEQGKQKYFWPLDEYSGNIAKESLKGNSASVINPLWIKKLHYEWQLLKTITANGPASIAFDAKNEVIHIVSQDSLKQFAIKDNQLTAVSYNNKLNLLRGNHSIYDNQNNRLLTFYTDQKTVSIFDPVTKTWSKNFTVPTPITDYWQFNKFYSPSDSSLYVLGGYGHFIFKNEIQQYNFTSDTWKKIKVSGDTFTPRYLAALGYNGSGAYIIGGYGSTTGQQMLNPRNLYDLLYFDVKKKTIKKIYELKIKGEDFVFANSLIINNKTKSYYALIFKKHKYKSDLQLIEGSLTNPVFKHMGSKIPFLFHDINSYADLFYCPSSKKYLAVTTFRNVNDITTVNIYSLYSPPLVTPIQQSVTGKSISLGSYVVFALVFLGIGLFLYIRSRKIRSRKIKTDPSPETNLIIPEPDLVPVLENQEIIVEPMTKSSIFLFGDLQVFDDNGYNITKQFTPLIKELFLIILLYTIRWERGISSDKLKEFLWFDKSTESARNNRSVNIAKLKSILENIGDFQISKDTGYWKINVNAMQTYVDYQEYFNIAKDKNKLNKEKITELAKIIKRGPFLSVLNYEWMDAFKAEISNEIIDIYLHFARSVDITEDPKLLIELANYIFYFDSVNEEAMIIKCKALAHLGQHSQSKNTYENFCKEYKVLYNDDFDKSFTSILQSENI